METDALIVAEQMGMVKPTVEALTFLHFALSQCPMTTPTMIGRESIPTEHVFTPGLYTRTVELRGPMIVATRVHLTEHPFNVSAGDCYVWDAKTNEVQAVVAPFRGVTKPGTFRILFVPNECLWTTSHVTDETDPEKIVETFTMEPTFCRLHD